MRVAFAGTPEFAVPALAALVASRHEVVGVLTRPDRPAGRGQRLATSPVKQHALAQGLPVDQPVSLRDTAGRTALARWRPDVLVVVAYGLILPVAALAIPAFGCVNIHASLLPRWRGAAPIQRAILAGDPTTGVTIMLLEAGLDTGPILRTRTVPIGPQSTSGSLHAELSIAGAEELLPVLDDLENARARPQVQALEGVTYAAKIDKSEAQIDWQRAALEIERQVRAFNPWPIAATRWNQEVLRIHRAAARPGGESAALPGTVLGFFDGAIEVACGTGRLAVTQLQRPGKRAHAAQDFANAVPLAAMVFG